MKIDLQQSLYGFYWCITNNLCLLLKQKVAHLNYFCSISPLFEPTCLKQNLAGISLSIWYNLPVLVGVESVKQIVETVLSWCVRQLKNRKGLKCLQIFFYNDDMYQRFGQFDELLKKER